MCSVYSALSGEVVLLLDDYEGKTAKEMKRFVASQIGVSRFRLRFLLEDTSKQLQDDEVFGSESVKIRLVVLEWWPTDIGEDTRMLAASTENDSVTLEELLACPRDPNVLHTDGGTPLHHAARAGHTEPMRLLLEAGAEKDARDTEVQGYTPLLVAALNCQADSVALLIQAGADTDLATLDYGGTALHFAALSGHVEVARLLIEGGADRELTTVSFGVIPVQIPAGLALQIALTIPNGATPLILAARVGYLEVVRLLVEAGADTSNATADFGKTAATHSAAQSGHVEVARLLIENRMDIDKGTTCGETPLYLAAQNGHVDVVGLLLAARADCTARTHDGATPFLIATQCGHNEITRLLSVAAAVPAIEFEKCLASIAAQRQ